jgi:hypothetical protein
MRNANSFSVLMALEAADQRLLLTAIATVIENREMPLHKYVALHPESETVDRRLHSSHRVVPRRTPAPSGILAHFNGEVTTNGNIFATAEVLTMKADHKKEDNLEKTH